MKRFNAGLFLVLAVVWLLAGPVGKWPLSAQNALEGVSQEIVIDDPTGASGRVGAPTRVKVRLNEALFGPARGGRLYLQEKSEGDELRIVAQFEGEEGVEGEGFLCWQMPSGAKGRRTFLLRGASNPFPEVMRAAEEEATGQLKIAESGKTVLRYNYRAVEPGQVLESIHPANRKYARARSDYIHPLYGLDGQVLTRDWSVDHPHHRGVYWAWPETFYRGEEGDLHALQRVFARPTGDYRLTQGPVYAQIEAENRWLWEDREPIVREKATIRVYALGPQGRHIDLKLEFMAIQDGVTVARRGTDQYGGLNIRLAATTWQDIIFHTDPAGLEPRKAWADFLGVFENWPELAGFAVLQRQTNPEYPGEWVKFPELQWFQPTFPTAGHRRELKPGEPLTLQYRWWIHRGGKAAEERYVDQWWAYQEAGGL